MSEPGGGFPFERLDAWDVGLRLVGQARSLAAQAAPELDWLGAECVRQASSVPLEVAAGASEWRVGAARRRFKLARAAAQRCGAAAAVMGELGAGPTGVATVRDVAEEAMVACERLVRG